MKYIYFISFLLINLSIFDICSQENNSFTILPLGDECEAAKSGAREGKYSALSGLDADYSSDGMPSDSYFMRQAAQDDDIPGPNQVAIDWATKYAKNESCIKVMADGYLAGKKYFFYRDDTVAKSMAKVDWKHLENSFALTDLSNMMPNEISQVLKRILEIQIPDTHRKCEIEFVKSFVSGLYYSSFKSLYTPEDSLGILDRIMPILSKYTDR